MALRSLPVLNGEEQRQQDPPDREKPVPGTSSWSDSVTLRSLFQLGFLLLNVWIGLQFYLWVRYYESGGQSISVTRPPGVEGWLPIASLMNLKAWVVSGSLPEIHPAGVFLLLAFLSTL